MKKAVCLVLVVLVLLLAGVLPVQARGHGHFFFWIGPGWGPWWWGPPAYPYYYGAPPIVVQQQPQIYVEPSPQSEEQGYWYFCPDPQGYYPYVKQCPKGWMKVVPPPAPTDWEE